MICKKFSSVEIEYIGALDAMLSREASFSFIPLDRVRYRYANTKIKNLNDITAKKLVIMITIMHKISHLKHN